MAQPSRRAGRTEALDEVVTSLGWRAVLPFGLLPVGGLVCILGAVSNAAVVTVFGSVVLVIGLLAVVVVSFVAGRRSGRGFWRSLFFTARSVLTAILDLVPV